MIARQILASGGLWLNLNGTEMLVDPGPGCIVQVNKLKLDPENLSAILLSHRHLDHSADTNIMVEAMTAGGTKPHGWLFAPTDALANEPVIYSYLRKYLDGVHLFEGGQTYNVNGVSFATPVRHVHTVETYGISFTSGDIRFAYIADSRYFEALSQNYRGNKVLIINVVMVERTVPVDHLDTGDAAQIIAAIKPEVAILTHFGMNMWRANPVEVADRISQQTGVRVIAARDGMKFNLADLTCE